MEKSELNNLLESIQTEICKNPADIQKIKLKLEKLLVYLCSPNGRIDENCKFVDNYFCFQKNWPEYIKHLPEELYAILCDIGGTLHDTVEDPKIASNFESLPEQLLDRVRKLTV
ncbi:MAG TPA: hypothetical protein VMW72_10795 [Sedimentisphaerales bacterium]|nr:hypothetical protein [Sedimentisphaerales bacterium]